MDLMNLVQSGAQFKVEASAYDLAKFGEDLVRKAMEEQRILDATRQEQQQKLESGEKFLTATEAAEMCNVCPTTLYYWEKSGYLVPCRIGRSKRYALSDIQRLLSNHGADASKAKVGVVPMNKAQQEQAYRKANAGL